MTMPNYDVSGVRNARTLFEATFPALTPTAAAAAPGRINLIGEHTDYQEGYVFPMALTKNTYVVGAKLSDGASTSEVVSQTLTFTSDKVPIGADVYARDDRRNWANAIIGMVALYKQAGYAVAPFAAALWSNVPLGAGVSSSAALEVSVGRFLEALNGLTVDDATRAKLARQCEHQYVGVNCGIMDQMISSAGRLGHALFIACSDPPRSELVALHAEDACVVVANSMQQHELGGQENWYNERVASCEAACQALGVRVLTDATSSQLAVVADRLEPVTLARARHVIGENERTLAAKEAFRQGKLDEFGRLMYASHASLRDDYTVSSTGLDTLVEIARAVPGVYGSRMSGAGFGGCTVTLVKKSSVKELINAMTRQYAGQMKLAGVPNIPTPDVFETTAGAGARELSLV